jgi:hypothetical protein
MPNAAVQHNAQPISQGERELAEEILRRPSDTEAVELGHQTDHHFVRVDPTPNPQHGRARQQLARLWNRHISLGVPHVACRDHLGRYSSSTSQFYQA